MELKNGKQINNVEAWEKRKQILIFFNIFSN